MLPNERGKNHQTFNKYDLWLAECVRQNNGRTCRVKGNIEDGATAYGMQYGVPLPVGQWRGNTRMGVVFNVRHDAKR